MSTVSNGGIVRLGTARHMRCDRCLRDFLVQHVHRVARWAWWCDNCILGPHGEGSMLKPRWLVWR